MSEIIHANHAVPIALPSPRVDIRIRSATVHDLAFIDALQKKTSNQVGFMPTKQLEGKIAAGDVLIAETAGGERAGYLIGCDRYFKREDVGIIYAINIVPAFRRSLVAAALLKAQFERSAYGCRLYCCWCAQDIEANRFWESMGFVALAYRAGSPTRGKNKSPRVHIFWQKRIRANDTSTPWWFPSQTTGGSIREDRLVLPIRPGMHWSEEQPLLMPGIRPTGEEPKRLPGRTAAKKKIAPVEATRPRAVSALRFASPAPVAAQPAVKAKREPRVKQKNDPKLVAAARELRDRWLEQVNESEVAPRAGKYNVSRVIDARPIDAHSSDVITVDVVSPKLLAA